MNVGVDGIRVRNLQKRYGNTVALAGVDLDIRPGEVLGVAGPNGAGKSTLVRIIAGEESADSGELVFNDRPWTPTEDWRRVAVVHQEPQLFPNLSVADNVMVGREGGGIGRPRLGASDAKVMEAFGIDRFADSALGDCTLATQQRTEIARAVARDAQVFLFDEPNSALTDEESDELFHEMHKLAAEGRIVLLVTHRLGDLCEHAGRVAVIRDGRIRTILEGQALNEDGLAQQLVVDSGADANAAHRGNARQDAVAVVTVADWTHDNAFRGVTLSAAPGEIVALVGVEGSGARELLRSLAGLEPCSGAIEIAGKSGDAAMRLAAYVPASRLFSLYSNFSVGDNLLVRLGKPDIAGFAMALKRKRMRQRAVEAISRFMVKAKSISQGVRSLSGGNQQKVAIAQALNCAPRLLLLEEPTRGVDIRSKREIYRLLRDYAEAGNAVVMFCTEVLEVYEAADRAHVVGDGALSSPIAVREYGHVEALATDIIRMERHARQGD
ncbi:MAG TPA: sugar ABC transporter ATP-binding protein [Roseiarcus sp.]|nr:sugar ABC transporter ATP-binding protein [Roseiarcus sp.]